MKFIFKNFGLVKKAQIKLNPLTLVYSENNTEKTWMIYAIYSLFAHINEIDFSFLNLTKNEIEKLRAGHEIIIDQDKILKETNQIVNTITSYWKENLPEWLYIDKEIIEKSELCFDAKLKLSNSFQQFTTPNNEFKLTRKNDNLILSILPLNINDISDKVINIFYRNALLNAFLISNFEQPTILTAERSGTVMFKDIMNLNTNRLFQAISKKEVTPYGILETFQESGYPDAIHSNVEMANHFESLGKRNSQLLEKHKYLKDDLETIVGGSFETIDGIIYFIPTGTQNRISIKNSSSHTRSLVHLWYWLIGIANSGQILMIEEPELNLHSTTQLHLAQFLARLVNLGVYVFIITHSNVIAREIRYRQSLIDFD